MDEIKLKKQIEVKRVGVQEIGMSLNMFIHCRSPEDAEELVSEDLVLCNLMIGRRSFQKKKQIKGRQCHKCDKLGHIQFHCKKEKVCWTCGESGHDAKDCKKEKKCILCNSNNHGVLYGGCPAKNNHRRELVKIQKEEEKKKMPISPSEKKKNPTKTPAAPSNPETFKLTKSQKKTRRQKEKTRNQPTPPSTNPAIKNTDVQVNKQNTKKEVHKEFSLEERLSFLREFFERC